jgi:beta-galactosidase
MGFGLCVALGFLIAARAGAQDRITLNFNPDWKFTRSDPAGAAQEGFDDSTWPDVSTPHSFNDVDTFNNFAPKGMRGEQNQWSGRTWYRKTFTLPASYSGKLVFLQTDAIRQVGEVYLNGRFLGVCKNGFIPFGFDLTPYVRFGSPNVLAVMCDNRFMSSPTITQPTTRTATRSTRPRGPTTRPRDGGVTLAQWEARINATMPSDVNKIQANQIPWNNPQWHPAMGGIYRDVTLYVTDPLHITLPLYDFLQTEGPYIYSTDVSADSATVVAEIPFENGRSTDQTVTVGFRLLDHDGNPVGEAQQNQTIAVGATTKTKLTVTIPEPKRWEPDYPYLYQAVCSLSVDGKVVDSTTIPIGIRTVKWDLNTGFWINGHHLKLHGWGQKPVDEWPGLADAQPDWMHYFTLDLMKEAGGNWVRWGHCAGGPAQIDACDRLGLMVQQPGVDGESDTVGAAWKIRAAAFRDDIIFHRNHPAILIWEGGNQKITLDHVKELRGIFDQYDPHGGRAYSQRRADETDGKFMDVAIGTEGSHEVRHLPVVEGEYDREESPRRVWDDYSPPNFGYPEAKGQTYDLTSEQYAVNEVGQYVKKVAYANHSGGANWIFSDSTSGGRNSTEVSRASGEVDGVRLPKEAYYVCQAMFRGDPQVHIIGHWSYPAGTRKTVYVVSNCGDVELFVNGKSLGHGKVSDRYLFTFLDVVYEPGEIKAVAYLNGATAATEILRTAGEPVALKMTSIMGPGGLRASGSDVALVDVEAVDANGQRCPTFQERVDFDCSGPAVWRGGYNSGKPGSINHEYLDLECGVNRVAIRSTLQAGGIQLIAHCGDLKPASLMIDSHEMPIDSGWSKEMPAMPEQQLPMVPPPPPMIVEVDPPATQPAGRARGRIISFSYSGPTTTVGIESKAADGKAVYLDKDFQFENLPAELAGADWVQTANADSLYSAVDLMQLEVKAGSIVYVAHDDRLAAPGWLAGQFKPTELSISVDGQPMKVFERIMESSGSLTLGSNTADTGATEGNAYVVFIGGEVRR